MPKGIYDRTKSKFNIGGFQKGHKIHVGKHPKTEFKKGKLNSHSVNDARKNASVLINDLVEYNQRIDLLNNKKN